MAAPLVWIGVQLSASYPTTSVADKWASTTRIKDRTRILADVEALLDAVRAGILDGRVMVSVEDSAATATGTITIAAGNVSNNDTVTIAGVVFTFKTSPTGSNPLEVPIGSTNLVSCANLLAAITANPFVMGQVYPTLATNVVTLTAALPGTWANVNVTLAKSGVNITVSAAALTGGTDTALLTGAQRASVGIP